MTVTYCDITGEQIEHSTTTYSWRTRDRRYNVIRGRDFSINGMQQLEKAVFDEMARSDRFSFSTYKKTLAQKIEELTE